MLKYKLENGVMLESEDGNYVLTADILPLLVGLKSLDERLKDFQMMFSGGTLNSEIFRDVQFIIEDLINGVEK